MKPYLKLWMSVAIPTASVIWFPWLALDLAGVDSAPLAWLIALMALSGWAGWRLRRQQQGARSDFDVLLEERPISYGLVLGAALGVVLAAIAMTHDDLVGALEFGLLGVVIGLSIALLGWYARRHGWSRNRANAHR